MTPEMLAAAGHAIYDIEHWRRPLADALGVSARTMQRWASGQVEIPDGVADDLVKAIEARLHVIGVMRTRLLLLRRGGEGETR